MRRSTFFTRFALAGSIALTLAASAFSACKTEEATTSDSSDTSSGSGGFGGTGGTPMVASSSSTGGKGGGQTHFLCMGAYTTAKMGTCDLLNQNCPPGQQCGAVKNIGTGKGFITQCVTATMGFKVAGEDCEFADECEAGLVCVLNRCAPVCCPASNEPCGSGLCIVQSNLGNSASDFVQTCFYGDQCQLFDPNSCPTKMGKIKEYCHFINQKMGVIACIANGGNGTPIALGDACNFLNDCGSNQGCNGGTCEWYCDPTMLAMPAGLGGCNPGDTCVNGGGVHYCVPKMVPKDAGGG